MIIRIETVRRKLFDVPLGQPTEFGLSQPLGQVQKRLIVLNLSIINIQLEADCWACWLDWQH